MEHIPERSEKEFAFTPVEFTERWKAAGEDPDAESIVSRYSESVYLRRLGAYLIDYLIVGMLLAGAMFPMILPEAMQDDWAPNPLPIMGVSFAILFGYFAILESIGGFTIGKWVLRIRVVRQDRSVPGVGKTLLRNLIKLLELSLFMLCGIVSTILILVTRKKQRLGDMAAGTFVLKVKDARQPSRGRLVMTYISFVAITAAAVIMLVICIGTIVKEPSHYKTADGQYELQAPMTWSAAADDYEGELFISNLLSDELVLIGSDDEYTLDGWVTLEEYNDIIADWLPNALEVELDGTASEKISLNGLPAYRFTMNGYGDGERQAYNVTVTGDQNKYYFIVSWISKTDQTNGSIGDFRTRWQGKLDHLDEIVGTFKSVRGVVSL
ncbi:RDD family protein [Paenibacillus sp. PR3]|uniref:RDD family protein n=1 Tax=Paenibacillus terricola TaxID=2763503 RepID=A0ABR8MZC9_9BACL|nr:RDD family protein [Paenibacillus terricola]MBD3921281.1 RDD family protein [Paenibacillus terricola]